MEAVELNPSFWEGRRVLVTGHTGFKGSWLVLWLHALGARVAGFALDPPTTPSLFARARVEEVLDSDVRGDVRDLAALSYVLEAFEPEVVIHMAAQPLVRDSYADPVGTYETNVMGTVHVFEAVRGCESVRAVVNVTTDKCYENREWEWGYREYEPKGGADPYSSSKACSELVTDAYRRSFFPAGGRVGLASARAGNVIGGGDWAVDRLVPDLFRAALEGIPLRVRNPAALRPWQHVLNPLSGYLMLASRLWDDHSFADGWNFGPHDRDAQPVAWIADRLVSLWGDGLGWTTDEAPSVHEAHYLKLDSSRAHARLGWEPRWDLSEGLARTVEWFRAYARGDDLREVTLAQIEAFQSTSPLLASTR